MASANMRESARDGRSARSHKMKPDFPAVSGLMPSEIHNKANGSRILASMSGPASMASNPSSWIKPSTVFFGLRVVAVIEHRSRALRERRICHPVKPDGIEQL